MKTILLITTLLLSLGVFAQEESHGNRTVHYTVELDRLKFEKQELDIEKSLLKMEGVQKCDVDALNYLLTISVFEPKENNNSIEIDDIKIILANNNVEIKNYTQKIIID